MLNNPPMTRDSMTQVLSIWGPIVPNLDGKRIEKGDSILMSVESIASIPPHIIINHAVVNIGIDVVYVNGIPFLATIPIVIKLGTVTEIPCTKVSSIVLALVVIVDTYTDG